MFLYGRGRQNETAKGSIGKEREREIEYDNICCSMIIYVVVLNVIYALECCLFVSLCHTGLWWREHGDSLNPFVKDLNRCFLSLP